MRIISGTLKGRKFTGKIPEFIRPTTDNVREAIFNILNNYLDFNNTITADFCAGTGFLGFEVLSRAGNKVYFFEKEPKACKLIENIAENFNINKNQFEIIKGDITKTLKSFSLFYPNTKFDLIFFDPPYKATFINDVLYLISNLKLLANEGLLIVETSDFTNLKTTNFNILTQKDYGGTKISIFKQNLQVKQ